MSIRVLLFGRLRDVAGWRERTCGPSPMTLSALRAQLAATDPALADALNAAGVQVAVDRVLAREDCVLGDGAEVAFMPAMSGG